MESVQKWGSLQNGEVYSWCNKKLKLKFNVYITANGTTQEDDQTVIILLKYVKTITIKGFDYSLNGKHIAEGEFCFSSDEVTKKTGILPNN